MLSLYLKSLVIFTMCGVAPSPAADDLRVLLFPTLAHQDSAGHWVMPVHGWVFKYQWDESQMRFWEELLIPDDKIGPQELTRLRRRLGTFLVDNQSGAIVEVSVRGQHVKSGAAAANGHFHAEVNLAEESVFQEVASQPADRMTVTSVNAKGIPTHGTVYLLSPTGISVISDIDDTIRATGVHSKRQMLKNTFIKDFQAINGMPALYQHWERELHAQFHYVSVCPWQLYEELSNFFKKVDIPSGSFHLKSVRLKDPSFWTLFDSPHLHKKAVITTILEQFPNRDFILVGDASERDPEIYGQFARDFPDRVALIAIRDPAPSHNMQRYSEAFRDMPAATWRIFRDPDEMRDVPLKHLTTTRAE